MRTSTLIGLVLLSVACERAERVSPPPLVALPPTSTTEAQPVVAPTTAPTSPGETVTGPWSDPDAVWDCPAAGTICRYAGGGSEVNISADFVPVDTRALGGAIHALTATEGLGLVASAGDAPSNTVVTLGPVTTTPLWWPGQPECVNLGEPSCHHTTLQAVGLEQVLVSWIGSADALGGSFAAGLVELDLVTGEETVRMGGEHGPDARACEVGQPATGCYGTSQKGAALPDGSLAIADVWLNRVWIVDPQGMVVRGTTVDEVDHPIDPTYAFDALPISEPGAVAVHGTDLYITDRDRGILWRVDTGTWVATWFAGTLQDVWQGPAQAKPYEGDKPALEASLAGMGDVLVDESGQVYLADSNLIRVIGTDGMVRRLAGVGGINYGPSGDGGLAVDAGISGATHLTLHDGYLYFVDFNTLVRRIWLP